MSAYGPCTHPAVVHDGLLMIIMGIFDSVCKTRFYGLCKQELCLQVDVESKVGEDETPHPFAYRFEAAVRLHTVSKHVRDCRLIRNTSPSAYLSKHISNFFLSDSPAISKQLPRGSSSERDT